MAKAAKSEYEQFNEELAELGLSEFLVKAIDREDMSVSCLSTGLPRLDAVLHKTKHGLPLTKRIEIYSRDPEVGKTSLALAIGVAWQKFGKKVAIVDIEDTVTDEYMVEVGFELDPSEDSGRFPVYLAKGFDDHGEVLSAETIADNIAKMANIFDLVIVDSIGALAKRADLERDPNDAFSPGGIGKVMFDHCRKTNHVKATVIWINQALPQIGVYSPNGIKYKTSGGNAIPFFSVIRLELRLVEKLKGNGKDDEPYGVVVDVYTAKNKVSPPYKHVKLTYLDGEGFSTLYDVFQTAISEGVIEKSGAWFNVGDERLGQGERNAYNNLKNSPELQKAVMDKLAEKEQPTPKD